MARILILILLVSIGALSAQDVAVIHESGYNHDYVIGRMTNLENLKDTTRHKYVATISVRCVAHPGTIVAKLSTVKMKMKPLGANGYFLSSFQRNDTIIDLTFRCYFINDNYFKINEGYRLKNKLVFFSHMSIPGTLQVFHLNDSCIHFNSENYYMLEVANGVTNKLYACNEFQLGSAMGPDMVVMASMKVKYKKTDNATFVGVYSSALIPKNQKIPKGNYPDIKCGLQDLNYDEGKILMGLMKVENQR